jgi:hypothetical protein
VSTISKSCVLYDDVQKLSFVYGFFGESLLFSKLVLWVSCGRRGAGWSRTSDAHFWECLVEEKILAKRIWGVSGGKPLSLWEKAR